MSAQGWRTYLVVNGGYYRGGRAVPVVIGLVETAGGGVQAAMRIGLDGEPVILPVQAGSQLIINLRDTLTELMKADKGGGSS